MKPLDELVDLKEPAFVLINEWLSSAKNDCVLLPPSTERGEVLVNTQVTTRSPLGAIAYEAGGVLTDHGWLRFPGSGHPSLRRTLQTRLAFDSSSAFTSAPVGRYASVGHCRC